MREESEENKSEGMVNQTMLFCFRWWAVKIIVVMRRGQRNHGTKVSTFSTDMDSNQLLTSLQIHSDL